MAFTMDDVREVIEQRLKLFQAGLNNEVFEPRMESFQTAFREEISRERNAMIGNNTALIEAELKKMQALEAETRAVVGQISTTPTPRCWSSRASWTPRRSSSRR